MYLYLLKQKKAQEEENIKLMEEKHLKDKLKAEFWNTKIIPYWSKMKNSKNIKKYFYEGIPTSTRGKIWALCIGNKFSITKEYYDIEANKSIQLIIKLNKNNIKKKNINMNKSPKKTPSRNSNQSINNNYENEKKDYIPNTSSEVTHSYDFFKFIKKISNQYKNRKTENSIILEREKYKKLPIKFMKKKVNII